MTPAQILRRASVAGAGDGPFPPAMSLCGQFRIWRVTDRQTGAHINVTVDTTAGALAPAHRVCGLCTVLASGVVLRDACLIDAPASARTDAHAAYLWAREQARLHLHLAEALASIGGTPHADV